jgi:hypothetical protein
VETQKSDGHWEAHEGYSQLNTGVTALAILALMDGNVGVLIGSEYEEAVFDGIEWLSSQGSFETGVFGEKCTPFGNVAKPSDRAGRSYHFSTTLADGTPYQQALATIVFCRAAKLRRTPSLLIPAQAAADFIGETRRPEGAWGYVSKPKEWRQNTSVSGWMVFATKAAQETGLKIDPDSYTGTIAWLNLATLNVGGESFKRYFRQSDKGDSVVRYGTFEYGASARIYGINGTSDSLYAVQEYLCMTAVGLRSRFFAGEGRENSIVKGHADFLLNSREDWQKGWARTDYGFWYHGTYAMFKMGNHYWRHWNKAMKETMQKTQLEDGSWPPNGPWGFAGGPVYTTAMACLCLSVYYSE